MPHTIFGLFHENDFRSMHYIKDLRNVLGPDTRFVILWDRFDEGRHFPDIDTTHLVSVDKADLLARSAQTLKVDPARLEALCADYKPFLKILLAIDIRRRMGIDYAIMTDNDLYLFDDIPEIRALSDGKVPFFVPEELVSDRLPRIVRLVHDLGRVVFYRPPTKGLGYNVGFCGLDLTMFDVVTPETIDMIIQGFEEEPDWCKEQVFVVMLAFSDPPEQAGRSMARVHGFDGQRYFFTHFDNPDYVNISRLYHCILSSNKAPVNMLYAHRYLWLPGTRHDALLARCRTRMMSRILLLGRGDDPLAARLVMNSFNPYVYCYLYDDFDGVDGHVTDETVEADRVTDPRAGEAWRRLREVTRRFFLHGGGEETALTRLGPTGVRFDLICLRDPATPASAAAALGRWRGMLIDGGALAFSEVVGEGFDPDAWAALAAAAQMTLEIDESDRVNGGAALVTLTRPLPAG